MHVKTFILYKCCTYVSSTSKMFSFCFFLLSQRIRDLEAKTDRQRRQIKDLEEKVLYMLDYITFSVIAEF